jgi:hypothetical protein
MFVTSSRHTASKFITMLLAAFCGAVVLGACSAPAMASTEAVPAPEANPASAQVNAELAVCPGQTFSQPFAALGDANYYTLVEGSEFDQGAQGWTLLGGARVLEGSRPDGSQGGVLDLPSGSIAVSPPVCVTLQYPSARTWTQTLQGGGSLTMAVAYNLTRGALGLPSVNVGSVAASGEGWEASRSLELQPQLGGREEGVRNVRFVFVAGGRHADYRVSGLYVDPRFGN